MSNDREEVATQVNARILAEVRAIAQSEGRPIQELFDEALADLIEKRRRGHAKANVAAAFQESLGRYGTLYKKLAE